MDKKVIWGIVFQTFLSTHTGAELTSRKSTDSHRLS